MQAENDEGLVFAEGARLHGQLWIDTEIMGLREYEPASTQLIDRRLLKVEHKLEQIHIFIAH
jgi:ribonuclease D